MTPLPPYGERQKNAPRGSAARQVGEDHTLTLGRRERAAWQERSSPRILTPSLHVIGLSADVAFCRARGHARCSPRQAASSSYASRDRPRGCADQCRRRLHAIDTAHRPARGAAAAGKIVREPHVSRGGREQSMARITCAASISGTLSTALPWARRALPETGLVGTMRLQPRSPPVAPHLECRALWTTLLARLGKAGGSRGIAFSHKIAGKGRKTHKACLGDPPVGAVANGWVRSLYES